MDSDTAELLPIAPYVEVGEDGDPHLWGSKCGECGTVYLGARSVCGRCTARDRMEKVTLAKRGKLYNYTVVHRSHPGIEVPFVSATVDLDGGGDVRGNLVGVAPDEVAFDMPVELRFDRARQTDAKGRSYLTYYFVPA